MEPVPTLTLRGFITDPIEGMSEIMSMYFSNHRSQSDLCDVQAISSDIAKSPDDATTLAMRITQALTTMYREYFTEGAEVTTRAEPTPDEPGRYTVKVSVTCVDQGVSYDLASTYEAYDGGFRRIVETK